MKLHYKETGTGEALIILHGLYGSLDNWQTIGQNLSKQYQVFLIDQRNHGRSPHSDIQHYELMQQDILEFIKDKGLNNVNIIGHSMGGKTAMYLALLNNHLVNKLIVVDIAPKSYLRTDKGHEQYKLHSDIIDGLLNIQPEGYKNRTEIDKQLANTIKSVKIRRFLLKNLTRDKNNKFMWKPNLQGIKGNLQNIINGFNEKDLKKFTPFNKPSLFLKGGHSDYISNSDDEFIKSLFPGASIVIIENAGHWVHAEQPEIFMTHVMDFLKGNDH